MIINYSMREWNCWRFGIGRVAVNNKITWMGFRGALCDVHWFTVDVTTVGNEASMGANFRYNEMKGILNSIVGNCFGMVLLARKEMVSLVR
jgi:hypothetical protein